MAKPLNSARLIALVVPAALLAGAYWFQYFRGLWPCELCWYQRYGHFAAVALALVSFAAPRSRALVMLAGLALLASALVGGFHAGVEYKWWEGFTACTSAVKFGSGSALDAIMAAPSVRCDEVQWSLLGISLAGYNFLVSGVSALVVFWLAGRKETV